MSPLSLKGGRAADILCHCARSGHDQPIDMIERAARLAREAMVRFSAGTPEQSARAEQLLLAVRSQLETAAILCRSDERTAAAMAELIAAGNALACSSDRDGFDRWKKALDALGPNPEKLL